MNLLFAETIALFQCTLKWSLLLSEEMIKALVSSYCDFQGPIDYIISTAISFVDYLRTG